MTSLQTFKTRLQRHLDFELELVVNENRSTMLSLLEKRGAFARLSLHKMFLEAPDHVLSAIAHYVRGRRKDRLRQNQILRTFIQQHLASSNYSHLVDPSRLITQGKIYNLKEMYEGLNVHYFGGKLALAITWFGRAQSLRRAKITFGQYLSGLHLIKIHRLLDDPFFPPFFVSFVIYHEMLHSVVPGGADYRGRFCYHGEEFKKREKAFEFYEEALEWERKNKSRLFRSGFLH